MGEPEEDTEGYVVEDDLGQILHNMFPFERYFAVLKKYVRN